MKDLQERINGIEQIHGIDIFKELYFNLIKNISAYENLTHDKFLENMNEELDNLTKVDFKDNTSKKLITN